MIKLFFCGWLFSSAFVVSIYSLSVLNINEGSIQFNSYKGKKILIVNTATGDTSANHQFAEMQEFYEQHHDSVVLIAFPSNSFGNEPGTNAQVKSFLQTNYAVSFPIAAKSYVRGDSANVIYRWLGSKQQNEMMDARTKRDFQKYLIDGTGRLVAKFDSSISVNSTTVQSAIANY